jgi:hypothetical protein
MRRGEARELAGMLGILVVVVGAGLGVSSMATDVVEVREVRDVPAVESPAATGPGQVVGPAASADPIPALPVGVSVGV